MMNKKQFSFLCRTLGQACYAPDTYKGEEKYHLHAWRSVNYYATSNVFCQLVTIHLCWDDHRQLSCEDQTASEVRRSPPTLQSIAVAGILNNPPKSVNADQLIHLLHHAGETKVRRVIDSPETGLRENSYLNEELFCLREIDAIHGEKYHRKITVLVTIKESRKTKTEQFIWEKEKN